MRKLILLVIGLSMLCSNAIAYTFDGEIDPNNFFTHYRMVDMEQMSPQFLMVSLKSETMKPVFALNIVIPSGRGVAIIAYAYLEDGKLRHFILDKKGHYSETVPDDVTVRQLTKKLYELAGITGV